MCTHFKYLFKLTKTEKFTFLGFTRGRGDTGGGPLIEQRLPLAACPCWAVKNELFSSVLLLFGDWCASDWGAVIPFRCKYTANHSTYVVSWLHLYLQNMNRLHAMNQHYIASYTKLYRKNKLKCSNYSNWNLTNWAFNALLYDDTT